MFQIGSLQLKYGVLRMIVNGYLIPFYYSDTEITDEGPCHRCLWDKSYIGSSDVVEIIIPEGYILEANNNGVDGVNEFVFSRGEERLSVELTFPSVGSVDTKAAVCMYPSDNKITINTLMQFGGYMSYTEECVGMNITEIRNGEDD